MANQNSADLTIVRMFDAPRMHVWQYWSEPEFMKKWWGPKQFTCPVSKIDFKVGGIYLHCMKAPDGKEFWSTGIYKEIVPLKRIVAADSFANEKGEIVSSEYYGMKGFPLETIVTVTFEEVNGKTKTTLIHSGIENIDDKTRKDMEMGWNESFDKLNSNFK